MMQLVGFELSTRNKQGDQYGFEIAGGKIAGHIDGLLLSGPSGFSYPALWECKTMNQKYWRDCVTRGLALSHPIILCKFSFTWPICNSMYIRHL